jgi:hypothetical protein
MLPPSLPEPTGVVLASRCPPSSRTAQVVGDWYDAIRGSCTRGARAGLAESTELMVIEVVANAVRFPPPCTSLRTDVLRREVGGDSPLVPRMRHAQLSDEGGRDLLLVDQLARRGGRRG